MHDEGMEYSVEELKAQGIETRDVSIPAIRKALIGFFGFTTLAAIASIWIFDLLVPGGRNPVAAQTSKIQNIPSQPNPLIQSNATAKMDIQLQREREDASLNSYGYINKQQGRVRIPVDRAIEIAVEKGLVNLPKGGNP